MALTYAGFDIASPTPDLRIMMERWWEMQDVPLWQWPGYGVERLHHLPVPDHPPMERARLNTLVWPTGASRWAVFHGLVGGEAADGIVSAVNAVSPTGQTLLIRDDVNKTQIAPTMYLAAVRPVFIPGFKGRLLWVTLVDRRYYWWTAQAAYTELGSGGTWDTLLSNLVTAANGGAGATIPSIPSAYGTPNRLRWSNQGKPLPLLIDAAANTVGLRCVAELDGSIAFLTPAAALALDQTRWDTYKTEVTQGGRNNSYAFGPMTAGELIGSIPANVAVSYWGDAQAVHSVSLASLSLPDYNGAAGVAGKYAWVQGDVDARTSSATYATQAARDYYGWRLSLTECTFRGIVALVGTGLEDRVEWEYAPGLWDHAGTPAKDPLDHDLPWQRIATRVVRWPLGDNDLWGDRPPPGYSYLVKLTATNGAAWKATIQTTDTGSMADGPQLGWGANAYCLYLTGAADVGNYAVATPDPLVPQRWVGKAIRVPGEPGGGVSLADCTWLSTLTDTSCLILTVPTAPTGGCACCIDDTQTFYLYPQGGGVWESTDTFATCNGSGVAKLDLSDPCCRPKLTLVGVIPSGSSAPGTDYDMWPAGCGLDDDNNDFADFVGGYKLCNGTEVCDCAACPDGTYTAWNSYFDFTGVTSTCSASLAGNWTFTRLTAGTCVWTSTTAGGATLTVSGSTGTLVFTTSGLTYSGSWDCLGTNVLVRTSLGTCDTAPATITLCPVPDSTPCRDSRFKVRLTCGACVTSASAGCCPPNVTPPSTIPVHIAFTGRTVTGTCTDAFGHHPADAVNNAVPIDVYCAGGTYVTYEYSTSSVSLVGDYSLTYSPAIKIGPLGGPYTTIAGWYADADVAQGYAFFSVATWDGTCTTFTPPRVRLLINCGYSGSPTAWILYLLRLNDDPLTGVPYGEFDGLGTASPVAYDTLSSFDCTTGNIGTAAISLLSCPDGIGGWHFAYGYEASAGHNCATPVSPPPPPPPTRYSCVASVCTETVGGTFGSLAECVAAGCTSPPDLLLTCASSPVPASAGPGLPATVTFSCTPSGGVPPYTFFWTFWGTITPSIAQNPVVTVPNPGGAVSGGYAHVIVTDNDGVTAGCSVGPFNFG